MSNVLEKLRYKFRYYFVRKKAPLSSIWWHEILRRRSEWHGSFDVSLAALNAPDARLSFDMGSPRENKIEIELYDQDDKVFETVVIPLSYRDAKRVMDGFDKAISLSRKKIREEAATQPKSHDTIDTLVQQYLQSGKGEAVDKPLP